MYVVSDHSIFFIYLFLLSNLLITIQYTIAQPHPDFVYQYCYGDNYTRGSTFHTNLNLLFPSSIKSRYYNATDGQTPNTVYGSLQCRGDIQQDECQSCINFATQDFNKTGRCPNSKKAIIWYDKCMLRYSNEYYFNIMQESPGGYLWYSGDVSNPNQYNQVLGDLMDDLAGRAASSFSTNFATGNKSINSFQKIYGLVECSPDIPSGSCNRCLRGAISELQNCCHGKSGARVIRPSCDLRYELDDPFFESPIITPPPSPPLSSTIPPSSTNTTVPNENRNKSSKLTISIVVPSVIAVLSAIAIGFFFIRRKQSQKKNFGGPEDVDNKTPMNESLQFDFSTVSAATYSFSEANKLGEGGFGSVYKGTLSDGRDIAVKRLSKYSGQGGQEFKNEVTLVAKLQHRNLVQLVGFSLAGEEKLLIYEFMPNASLDRFLFDPIKRKQLDWERRYKIIGGVARGLLYLHEESRLKIIHRDLKASNILLDKDMNPKISDFGMARLFVLDQTQERTSRIVGTYGYMAPEYIMHGHLSVRSDVFSFGVLVLEILCGLKNSSFHQSDVAQDLLSYVWKHWNNGSAIETLDPTLKDACSKNEVYRCIHVALLCVQENVADRPTMPIVVQMLNSYSATNPALPLAPAFFAGRTIGNSEAATWSRNEVSVTELDPR